MGIATNDRTQAEYQGPEFEAIRTALNIIEDHPDRIPHITRYNGKLYNFWTDANQPRGVWRRTTLESYRTNTPDWEIVLDFDALAATEKEDWAYEGCCVIPKTCDRAILKISRGGTDAAVLREFDLTTCSFVDDGFNTPGAVGNAVWYDRDTLLLISAIGQADKTSSGYPRTVRIWRRGTDLLSVLADKPLFEIDLGHQAVDVEVEEEVPTKRLIFIDYDNSSNMVVWIGDLSGVKKRLDLPSKVSACWEGGWLALKLCTLWNIDGATYTAGTLLGIGLNDYVEGSRAFEVLFTPSPCRIIGEHFWKAGRLVVSVMDNLVARYTIFAPSERGWTRKLLGHMPDPEDKEKFSVQVSGLDEDSTYEDLLVRIQNPLKPERLLLTSVTSAPPLVLKCAPEVFNTHGMSVSWHKTDKRSTDGERICYVQIGPQGESSDAPVYMTGYGGFNYKVEPFKYRGDIGKIWLERRGTVVFPIIRGGGEFGPKWYEDGVLKGKRLCYDDFAAVARDLVERKVTRPGRIAAEGSSNGGLLILNMLTHYPNSFGALSSNLPLADMWRYTKLLAGPLWISEYGDPTKPKEWEFLQHISPYHNVTAEGTAPPVLIIGSRLDDRVHVCHGRKMTAKLQSMGREVSFFEQETGGHSFGKCSSERATSEALVWVFLSKSIGWKYAH